MKNVSSLNKTLKILGTIIILVFLTIVAQAGDWPMFHHDPARTGYTNEIIPEDLELLWSYDTGGDWRSSPTVAYRKVFVGNHYKIYCLNASTGNMIWSYETGDGVYSSPAVADGKVFVGSYDNKIYCLDENTGKLMWSYETGDSVCSSPAVANGKVFFGSRSRDSSLTLSFYK